jgi:hypothetical protein
MWEYSASYANLRLRIAEDSVQSQFGHIGFMVEKIDTVARLLILLWFSFQPIFPYQSFQMLCSSQYPAPCSF